MALTAKQQAQVAKSPQPQRATMRARFERDNALRVQLFAPRAPPSRPVRSVRPATPAVPRAPKASLTYAFDAFDKRHLPLDEVTAPYTTTNFIGVMEFCSSTTIDQIIVVCPRLGNDQSHNSEGPMSDFIAMRYDAAGLLGPVMPVLDTLRSPILGEPAITSSYQHSSVRARLHNLSVRLECMGTNTGLYPPGSVYIGTVPSIENGLRTTGAQESLTMRQAWAEDSIAVGYLRSIPAASLVSKPMVLHAAVAENVSYKTWRDFEVPTDSIDQGAMSFSTALEPIVIYVPRTGAGDTVVNYRVVVGQQWCSRHPHNIMLRSTQKQHDATSPDLWHSAIKAVKDVGAQLFHKGSGIAADVLLDRLRTLQGPRLPMLVD